MVTCGVKLKYEMSENSNLAYIGLAKWSCTSPAKPIWPSTHHPFIALLLSLNLLSSSSKNEQHTAYVQNYFTRDQKSGRSPSFCSCQSAVCRLKDVSWCSGNGLEKLIWHANIAFIQLFQIFILLTFHIFKTLTKSIIKKIPNPEQYPCDFQLKGIPLFLLCFFLFLTVEYY